MVQVRSPPKMPARRDRQSWPVLPARRADLGDLRQLHGVAELPVSRWSQAFMQRTPVLAKTDELSVLSQG
jgi:hypothetical protein